MLFSSATKSNAATVTTTAITTQNQYKFDTTTKQYVNNLREMFRDRIGQWANGENVCPSKTSGLDRLKDPNMNKVIIFKLP